MDHDADSKLHETENESSDIKRKHLFHLDWEKKLGFVNRHHNCRRKEGITKKSTWTVTDQRKKRMWNWDLLIGRARGIDEGLDVRNPRARFCHFFFFFFFGESEREREGFLVAEGSS